MTSVADLQRMSPLHNSSKPHFYVKNGRWTFIPKQCGLVGYMQAKLFCMKHDAPVSTGHAES